VRLAAQLTGWRIDIHSEAKHQDMLDAAQNEIARVACLDDEQVELLVRSGFQSAQEVSDAELAEIAGILEVDEDAARQVIEDADAVVGALIMEEAEKRSDDVEE
jgi:N utilization substance protein A